MKRVLVVDHETDLPGLICEFLTMAGGLQAERVGDLRGVRFPQEVLHQAPPRTPEQGQNFYWA